MSLPKGMKWQFLESFGWTHTQPPKALAIGQDRLHLQFVFFYTEGHATLIRREPKFTIQVANRKHAETVIRALVAPETLIEGKFFRCEEPEYKGGKGGGFA